MMYFYFEKNYGEKKTITVMVLQVSDSITFLLAVPAPTTTPAEPSHVGEITIEDISDHTDTGTMEETEPISAVEPENEDGERVRNTTCPINDTCSLALNVIGCLRFS